MYFFIKKGSTLPSLKLESCTNKENFSKCMQNAKITFTMWDETCNRKVISCRPVKLELIEKSECNNCFDGENYCMVIEWKERDTKKCGNYKLELTLETDKGTMRLPHQGYIDVIVN